MDTSFISLASAFCQSSFISLHLLFRNKCAAFISNQDVKTSSALEILCLSVSRRTNYIIGDFASSVKKRFGDPYRIRTDVNGVRGRCLNHLTNGPRRRSKLHSVRFRLCRKLTPLRCPSSSRRNRGFAAILDERRQSGVFPIRGISASDTPRTGMVHLHGLEPGTH